MKAVKKYQFWFCTGSQDLYSDECLRKVAEHSHKMADAIGIESVVIDENTTIPALKNELRWNLGYYR